MYHLHFHEGKQQFKIIETGATFTPAYDGETIHACADKSFLHGLANAILMVARVEKRKFTYQDLLPLLAK